MGAKGKLVLLAALCCLPAACRLRNPLQTEDRDAIPSVDRRVYETQPEKVQGDSKGGAGGGTGGTGADGGGGTGADGGGCSTIPEMCNMLDDNCDGRTDEDYDLTKDRDNCGTCGNQCKYPHAVPLCVSSACTMGECFVGFFDANKDAKDGCECVKSNGGMEICDEKDNDCDNVVDDGFDKMTDVAHCGSCIKVCGFANAKTACEMGVCKMKECLPNFYDIDKNPMTGCEYACIKSGVEVCDGFDNDCDGMADNGTIKGVGDPCGAPEAGVGECKAGSKICVKGVYLCMGATFPEVETCNLKDDDCDGSTDNGFDKMNDPVHCGGCTPCSLKAHMTVAGCSGGSCNVAVCESGWTDANGSYSDGCESNCIAGGPEICDGLDNDCDGMTDGTDPSIVYPTNFCVQVGECMNGPGGSTHYSEKTFPICTKVGGSPPDWICNYPATVEQTAPGVIAPDETKCDSKDNDCDSGTDEPFAGKGTECGDDKVGACRTTGKFVCNTDGSGLTCDLAMGTPGAAPADETCNDRDDDCDGETDEAWDNPGGAFGSTLGVRDDLVATGTGAKMYRWEASRQDASGASAGVDNSRACSRHYVDGTTTAVYPWSGLSYAQAVEACMAAGMRLCTATEWGTACSTTVCSMSQQYPYGCTYGATTCNGRDRADPDVVLHVGDMASCVSSASGAYDMSGNLAEWTDPSVGTTSDGTGRKLYTLRGGAYDNVGNGLRCNFMSTVVPEDFNFPTTGFRCCTSCADMTPQKADCGGSGCKDLATDASHCGLCGRACTGGKTCQNGVCK